MNKYRKVFLFFSFLLFFTNSGSFAQNYSADDINFPSIMLSSRKFQTEIRNLVYENTGIKPSYYVITFFSDNKNEWVSDFFECLSFEENSFARDFVYCTAPFYVVENSSKECGIAFSFAFPSDLVKECQITSDFIYNKTIDGTFSQLAEEYSVNHKIQFSDLKKKPKPSSIIAGLVVFFLVTSIIFIVIFSIIYKKNLLERKEQNVKALDEELTKQLEKEAIEKYKTQIIEPVTGLFTTSYIKEQIKKEISQFDIFGKNFSVAIFTTKEASDIEKIKKIAAIIKENLNSGVVTAYKGDGIFLVLFTNKESDEIGIFVDLVVEKIYQANISISSEIFDFKGQMTFLGKLGLDERRNQSESRNLA